MIPLYHDPCFTFRFVDDRQITRFHLEGVEPGQRVAVFKIDPVTEQRFGQLAIATVGDGGWVELLEPILIRTGDTSRCACHSGLIMLVEGLIQW